MSHQDEQIDFLNSAVKIKVAPSKIHGVGLFATRDIPKGAKLFADMFPKGFQIPKGSLGKLFPEVREYLEGRWPRITLGEPFMWPDTLFQAYCNHDNDPNYDCLMDVTLKPIWGGEEITEDYRQIRGWEEAHKWLLKKPKKKKK